MHVHPTPAEIKYQIKAALYAACQQWEAETGKVFPYIAASRAVDAGISAAIAEHEAMKARLLKVRAA